MIFAGAVTKDDIDSKVIPAIQPQLETDRSRATAPTLDDAARLRLHGGSTGSTIISLFDANKDCTCRRRAEDPNSLVMSLLCSPT